MQDVYFHWRKYDAAHWLLYKITTSKKEPYRKAIFSISPYGEQNVTATGPYLFQYKYEKFSFNKLKQENKEYSDNELEAGLDALNVNKHINVYGDIENQDDYIIQLNEQGRIAYEQLYYVTLKEQQKSTSVGLMNAENNLIDFAKGQWYRHRNYIIAIAVLFVGAITIILEVRCKT